MLTLLIVAYAMFGAFLGYEVVISHQMDEYRNSIPSMILGATFAFLFGPIYVILRSIEKLIKTIFRKE